ncbi:MAG: 2'-5' RNA ligase family protein [Verrucomicrobiaceae bacterium]|nr:MAG: 2'-5' RNA ligase family protein [Verrucomicrobiaceae bacterium]
MFSRTSGMKINNLAEIQRNFADFDFKSYDPATRVYLMIYPPADKAAEMTQIASDMDRSHGLKGTLRQQEGLHVTLGMLGPLDKVIRWGFSSWLGACDAAARRTDPFEIELDSIVGSGGGPVILRKRGGNEALSQFHSLLRTEMAWKQCKFHRDTKKFSPHVTILYSNKNIACELPKPARWMAGGFGLILSVHGASRHDLLKQWDFRRSSEKLD